MLHGHLVALDVESEHAGVLVEVGEGLELVRATDLHLVRHGVHHPVARDVARHQPDALLVGTDDRRHDHERDRVGALPRHALPADADVGRRPHLVVAVEQLGPAEVGFRGGFDRSGACLHAPERLRDLGHHVGVLHAAGGADDRLVRGPIMLDVRAQVRRLEPLHAVVGADGGEAERVVAERAGVEPVVDDGARGLRPLLEAAQDPRHLLVQVAHRRRRHEVGEDADALLHVLAEARHGQGRLLAPEAGAQRRAHALDLTLEGGGGPLCGAGQRQLLEEVRGADGVLGLVAHPGVQEDPHARQVSEALLGDDAHAVGQGGGQGWGLVPHHGLGEHLGHGRPA
mmetsp:Transcript_27192/g.72504  ORF Transcript_27192/g.72504 Transcript_27192/m.72504 type:complete len:342 (-) Transcript_27192:142-1167(-)